MRGGKDRSFFFSPPQQPIEGHEKAQADQEEYDPALVMQPSEQEIGIHIFRQDGQGGDAPAERKLRRGGIAHAAGVRP